jgi:hypothetical protein
VGARGVELPVIRASIASFLVSLLLVGCGGGESETAVPPSGQTSVALTDATTATPTAEMEPLVGRWEHVNECRNS